MAYTLTQLTTFFTNANAGTAPTAAQIQGLQGIANQNATGTLSDAQALQSAIDMGSDVTTAVSIQSYQFFLGFAPSVAGLKALNAAYTGSGAQAALNGENRFIAQAVSLALQNPTAKASFTAAYGSSSVADATAAAYNVIIGNTAAAAAGVNVANAVAFLSSASSIAYFEAFVKANVPGLAAADVSLAVKAAIVGEIIYQATIFNNGAGLGSYATAANNLVKDLADDGALTADNASGIALFDNYGVSPVAQTLTLTTAADTLNGAAGADTFVATNTTLSASDNLTGGAGVDTLNYASNGTGPVNQAGFKAAGIETYNITSDATGGTTFDMSGVTGATRVVNDDSSFDLTVTGLNEAATIVVRNTSQSTATVNTFVNYNAAVTNGATTTQALILENVFDPAQPAGTASKSAVTVNGVEIFNITGSGSATSNLTALNSSTLTTVNIDGGQGVKIDSINFAGTTGTVDGSKNTGGINVTLADSGNEDVTVTGGTGNDRADFSAGFAAKDSFAGGAGTDTLVVSNTIAVGAVGGTLTGVEVLEISGGGNGSVDLSKFAGVTDVVYTSSHVGSNGNSLANAVTVSKAGATSTITADVGGAGQNLTVSVATDGAADATTINLNKVAGADAMGTITVTDIETLTLNIADDTTVAGTGVLTLGGVSGNKVTKVNVNSNADVTITGAVGGAALTSFDLSAATGKATLTGGITTALTGATIKLGAGDDQVNVTATTGTATGGDTITLGAGKDVVTYTTIAQSGDKTTDTITDFKSGEDKLDLTATAIGLNTSSLFLGARANFGLAQGALTGKAGQAVFQADTNTLWVDSNNNAQLDAGDFRIILTGVTSLTNADLSLGTGASITLTAAGQKFETTSATATLKTTNENDTVSTSFANIAFNNTSSAGLGTDTLKVTSQVTADTTIEATTASFEVVSLDAGTASTATVTVNGAGTADNVKVAVSLGASGKVTVGTDADGFTVTGSSGNDTITSVNAKDAVSAGAGDDTVVLGAVTYEANTIDGGTGTDTLSVVSTNFSAATVSGFENLTIANNSSVTMSLAQHAGFTTISSGNTERINLSTAGTFTTVANIERYDLASATGNVVTLSTGNTTVNGGTSADTINATATIVGNATITGGTGAGDILNITTAITAAQLDNVSGFETIKLAGAANALTAANTLVAATETLTIDASALTGTFTFAGANEADGKFVITGSNQGNVITSDGAGDDTFNLGTGNDTVTVSTGGVNTINLGGGDDVVQFGGLITATNTAITAVITNFTVTTTGTDDTIGFSIGDLDARGAGNPNQLQFSTTQGNDIAAALGAGSTNLDVQAVAANAGTTNLSGVDVEVIKLTSTTATSFATAIGTTKLTTANLATAATTAEAVLVTWYDSVNSKAVVGYVVDADNEINNADTFVQVATVGMTAAEYGNLDKTNFYFF